MAELWLGLRVVLLGCAVSARFAMVEALTRGRTGRLNILVAMTSSRNVGRQWFRNVSRVWRKGRTSTVCDDEKVRRAARSKIRHGRVRRHSLHLFALSDLECSTGMKMVEPAFTLYLSLAIARSDKDRDGCSRYSSMLMALKSRASSCTNIRGLKLLIMFRSLAYTAQAIGSMGKRWRWFCPLYIVEHC